MDTDTACAALKDVFEDTRSILEPAGALSIAGAAYVARWRSTDFKPLVASIKKGIQTKGLAFIEVLLQCPTNFGRYVLKMSPLIVLGACAGAGTITAALRAIQDESRSSVPALGYTVPYAIGNILLTAWGPVLVTMMMIGK